MKILLNGVVPQKQKVYECRCRNCGCRFEFERHEATLIPDQRDGDLLIVKCPQPGCNRDCSVVHTP